MVKTCVQNARDKSVKKYLEGGVDAKIADEEDKGAKEGLVAGFEGKCKHNWKEIV